jgi:hypothetical protein
VSAPSTDWRGYAEWTDAALTFAPKKRSGFGGSTQFEGPRDLAGRPCRIRGAVPQFGFVVLDGDCDAVAALRLVHGDVRFETTAVFGSRFARVGKAPAFRAVPRTGRARLHRR